MPIIDAYADLCTGGNSVGDYLRSANKTHVLRMVAIQNSAHTGETIEEGLSLQRQSTTPGLSGFPNALVAHSSLSDSEAVSDLLNKLPADKLRGLHYVFEKDESDLGFQPECFENEDVNAKAMKSALDEVQNNNLSLDVTGNISAFSTIAYWAQTKPDLDIILNLSLSLVETDAKNLTSLQDKLVLLSQQKNIQVKLLGSGMYTFDVESALELILDFLLEYFSDARLLFGSGCHTNNKNTVTFDELWGAYLKSTQHCSASARNNMFRLNAARIYLE